MMPVTRTASAPDATLRIRNLGSDADWGCSVTAEQVYNLIYGDNRWMVIRVTGGTTLVLIGPDGSPLEVV